MIQLGAGACKVRPLNTLFPTQFYAFESFKFCIFLKYVINDTSQLFCYDSPCYRFMTFPQLLSMELPDLFIVLNSSDGCFCKSKFQVSIAIFRWFVFLSLIGVICSRHETTIRKEFLHIWKTLNTINFKINCISSDFANTRYAQKMLNIFIWY